MSYTYKIRNIENGNFYVGSAIAVDVRWRVHKSQLNRGVHKNIHLQRAWNKYGKVAFSFELIEECLPDELIAKEQILLDEHVGKPYCYNILPFAYSPGRGRVWAMEERAKAAENATGLIFSKERRNAISFAKNGKPVSDETKAKLKKAMKTADCRKFKFSAEQKDRMREMFATGQYTQKYLAGIFNCSQSQFGRIVRNLSRSERY